MLEINAFPFAQVFKACKVTNWCIQPDIKVFPWCVRNLKSEVGRVTAYIPLLQASIQPLSKLVGYLWLQRAAAGPLGQKISKVREFEEIVLRLLLNRYRTRDSGARINQLGWCVSGTAGFAIIAILIVGFALRAGALDKPVCKKQLFLRIVSLGDFTLRDVPVGQKLSINVFRELSVFFRVRGVVIIKMDVEVSEILLVLVMNTVNQLLRGNAFPIGPEHNSGAMSVVCANVVAVLAAHFLITGPDVRLNVFQQVAQMNGAIGVGQGAGYQNIALLL